MKKISILILTLITLTGFYSCSKKENKVILNPDNISAPVIKGLADGASLTFTKANRDSTLLFTWSPASYGFNTAIDYYLQVDNQGNNFQKAMTVGHTKSKDSLQIVVNALNNKILLLEQDPEVPLSLDVSFRVIAIINSHVDTAFSKPVNVTITPFYIPIIYPQLYVPGAYQGWSPGTADSIGSLNSDGNYEGYIYMDVATEFKFTSARDWGHINYGYAAAGELSTDGGAGNLSVSDSGFYKFNVNTTDLTWTYLKTTWGLIGDATPGGWDTDTPMHYSPATQLWTVTLNLTANSIKFRANGSWALNYGSDKNDGKLQEGSNTNIAIPKAGNYTVILDLSHTVYKYKLIKN